jgi:hypothetical protein
VAAASIRSNAWLARIAVRAITPSGFATTPRNYRGPAHPQRCQSRRGLCHCRRFGGEFSKFLGQERPYGCRASIS